MDKEIKTQTISKVVHQSDFTVHAINHHNKESLKSFVSAPVLLLLLIRLSHLEKLP